MHLNTNGASYVEIMLSGTRSAYSRYVLSFSFEHIQHVSPDAYVKVKAASTVLADDEALLCCFTKAPRPLYGF